MRRYIFADSDVCLYEEPRPTPPNGGYQELAPALSTYVLLVDDMKTICITHPRTLTMLGLLPLARVARLQPNVAVVRTRTAQDARAEVARV